MIFYPVRSARRDCWAERNDRPRAQTLCRTPGEASRLQPWQRLLSASSSVRRRSGLDAADRRTAPRLPVRGKSDVARALERRRAGGWAAARRHADEEDGHRGDLSSPEHIETGTWAQNLSLPPAKAGGHPTQPGLG